jgi:hypothetical protein
MSFLVNKLQIKQHLDPRIFFKNKDYVVVKGSQNETVQRVDAPAPSNSGANFTLNFPERSIIDGKIVLAVPVTFSFSCTAGGTGNPAIYPIAPYKDALRAYPLSSVISNVQLQIEKASFNIQLSNALHPLSRLEDHSELNNCEQSNATPTFLDNTAVFASAVNTAYNPFALYGDFNSQQQAPRGAFPTKITLADGSATVEVTIQEEIRLSPLSFGRYQNTEGWSHITSMQLQVAYQPNLFYMWSHVASGQPAGYSFDSVLFGISSVYYTILTPRTLEVIPDVINKPYSVVQTYMNSVQNVADGAFFSGNSGNISLTAIPDLVLVCARRSRQSLSTGDPSIYADSYFGAGTNDINTNPTATGALQVTWEGVNSVFSNFTVRDLYNMSVRNGVRIPWESWCGRALLQTATPNAPYAGVGSIVAFRSTDLPLNDGLASGVGGRFQLAVNYSAINNFGETVPAELLVLTVTNGMVQVFKDGSVISSYAPLSYKDVLDSKNAPYTNNVPMYGEGRVGGSWQSMLSGLKDMAMPLIKEHLPKLAEKGAQYAVSKLSGGKKLGKAKLKHMLKGRGLAIEDEESEESQE